jgi:hypothetical protein
LLAKEAAVATGRPMETTAMNTEQARNFLII